MRKNFAQQACIVEPGDMCKQVSMLRCCLSFDHGGVRQFDAKPVPANLEPEEVLRLAEVAHFPW